MNANRNDLIKSPDRHVPVRARNSTVLGPDFVGQDEGEFIDLLKISSVIWRNRFVIIAIMAASLALGIVSLFLSSPTYRATASIEIDNQPVKVLGTEDYQQISSPQETDRLLQTQIDVLRSRGLAERVAADLNLTSDDHFLATQGVEARPDTMRQKTTDALQDGLSVSLPHNSRVVPVSFDSPDPALAAKVANRYVDDLIAGNLQRHFDTSKYSKDFLQNQLELTKARLENSERALLDYARSVGIVDPSAGTDDAANPSNNAPRSLTSANLIDLNQALAAAKAARMQAEGKWHEAQATGVMSLPDVLENPAIQQLTQKRAELQSQYQQDLQHRKPDHPVVLQEAAALHALDNQIAALAGSIRQSIFNQYRSAEAQESELFGAVGQLKGATLAEQQLGIRYNILKREVDTNRQLYDGLLQRFKEVSAESGVTTNNISVIDRAEAPLFPVSPRPFVNLTLALLFGIAAAIGAVLAIENLHDGVREPEEVEQRFGIPLLGHTPRLGGGALPSGLLLDSASPVSEAYQAVRTSLELSTEAGTPKTMLVTSGRPGEGKSTTALAMARHAAMSGRTVLLIDADMRRPSLHQLLNVSREPGLSTFLTQQINAESIIHQTDTPGMSFMSAGPKPPSPAELVSGGGMRALLNYLADRFDQIIIDGPPVLGLADAPRLASVVDATMMVIEANRAHRGAVESAIRRLSAARAHIIGAVLVKFDPSKADFGSAYMDEYYGYGEGEQEQSPTGLIPSASFGI